MADDQKTDQKAKKRVCMPGVYLLYKAKNQ